MEMVMPKVKHGRYWKPSRMPTKNKRGEPICTACQRPFWEHPDVWFQMRTPDIFCQDHIKVDDQTKPLGYRWTTCSSARNRDLTCIDG